MIILAAIIACIVLLYAKWDWWYKSPVNQPETFVGKNLGKITTCSFRNIFIRIFSMAVLSPVIIYLVMVSPIVIGLYILGITMLIVREVFLNIFKKKGDGELANAISALIVVVLSLSAVRGIIIITAYCMPGIILSAHLEPLVGWDGNPFFGAIDKYGGVVSFIIIAFFLIKDCLRRTWQINQLEDLPTIKAASAAIGLSELKGIVHSVGEEETPVLKFGTAPENMNEVVKPFYLQDMSGNILVEPGIFRIRWNAFTAMLDINGVQEIVLTRHVKVNDETGEISKELRPGDPVYVIGKAERLPDDENRDKNGARRRIRQASRVTISNSFFNFMFGRRSLEDVFFISDTDEVTASQIMRRNRRSVLVLGILWLALCLVMIWSGTNTLKRWQQISVQRQSVK